MAHGRSPDHQDRARFDMLIIASLIKRIDWDFLHVIDCKRLVQLDGRYCTSAVTSLR